MFTILFGKYRFLVVSIALFLIFDLGVLVLNFYTSGKIAEQAELINLAGRQRTLTQQMSKATLYVKAQKLRLWVYQSGLDELRDHYAAFGDNLLVLNKGGTITSAQTGSPVDIAMVRSDEGVMILQETKALWAGFDKVLAPLMVDTLITDEEIAPASAFIAANNIKLYELMDQLTEHFIVTAERQTNLLRSAQVIGISLATINFFIILIHFLGQLRGLDRKVKIKEHESDQILSTIGEGVFLLNEELKISGQHSKQLEEIFATNRIAGRNFQRFLSHFFTKKVVATATDFVKLYFRDHIDHTLIRDVNPLRRVEASIVDKSGESEQKFLDFSFARLDQGDNENINVLVTVKDVTAAILLEKQDEKVNDNLNQQMALLTQILPIPKPDLDDFIDGSVVGFERINELLKDTKNVSDNYTRTLIRIAREIHKLKGDAAALGLDVLTQKQHTFEDNIQELQALSKLKKLNGRDLLPLTLKLKGSFDSLEMIIDLREKLGNHSAMTTTNALLGTGMLESSDARPAENKKWFALNGFAQQLANREGVSVDVKLRGFNVPIHSDLTEGLYSIGVQLLRNSIAHGVENSETRLGLKKPDCGQVTISYSHDKKGNYRFLFEDDGCGFDYEAIRRELIQKGVLAAADANALGHTALVQHAFKDSVSTRKNVDAIAGRGVGLPLVWQQIRVLGGKLKIRSVRNEFTQFIIDFSYVELDDDNPLQHELLQAG